MDDFDLESRRKKILNVKKSDWQKINKNYYEKIEEMKTKNEDAYRKKVKEFRDKLRQKEINIKRQKEAKNAQILAEKKRMQEITKKKSDDVLKNLEEYNRMQEEKRLRLEKDTFIKCNNNINSNYYFFCFIL